MERSKIILSGGLALPGAEIPNNVLEKIQDELTFTLPSKQWGVRATVLRHYQQWGKYLVVPRAYGLKFLQKEGQVWRGKNGRPVEDRRTCPSADLQFKGTLRLHQVPAVAECLQALHRHDGLILKAKPGTGKCLAPDTPVVTYDGQVIRADQVTEGTLLASPSGAKTVLSTNVGNGQMFEVVPIKGEPWRCNDCHVLTLVHSTAGDVMDIPLNEFMAKPQWERNKWKLFIEPTGIDFDMREDPRVDPYFLGLWVGDGTKTLVGGRIRSVALSKPDVEVEAAALATARCWGLSVRTDTSSTGGCPTHHLTQGRECAGRPNPLLEELRALFGDASGIIPDCIRCGSRGVRLQFLAGIIDSDGHLNNCGFEVTQKRRSTCDGVAFIARSLGFRCSENTKVIRDQVYHRLHITGPTHTIPTRIERKKAPVRRQIKRAERTGFELRRVGRGSWAGFTLDGDGRFLLGDFTVTHNTVMACALMAQLGTPALVLVDNEQLRDQWVERVEQFLGIPRDKVGMVSGTTLKFGLVTIGMIQTLSSRDCSSFVKKFGLLVGDEVHIMSAPSFSEAIVCQTAKYRLGLSATPRRKDGLANVFKYHFGEIRVEAESDTLSPAVAIHAYENEATEAQCQMRSPGGITMPSLQKINAAIVDDEARTARVGRIITYARAQGHQTLVLAHYKRHLQAIKDWVDDWIGRQGANISSFLFVGGTKRQNIERERQLAAAADILFSTWAYASKGMDIPSLSALVMASPQSDVEQACGRICRQFDEKVSPQVFDLADTCARSMSHKRLTYYNSQNWEVDGADNLDETPFARA